MIQTDQTRNRYATKPTLFFVFPLGFQIYRELYALKRVSVQSDDEFHNSKLDDDAKSGKGSASSSAKKRRWTSPNFRLSIGSAAGSATSAPGSAETPIFPKQSELDSHDDLVLNPIDMEATIFSAAGIAKKRGILMQGALSVDVGVEGDAPAPMTPFAVPESSLDSFIPTPFDSSTPAFTSMYKKGGGPTTRGTLTAGRRDFVFSPPSPANLKGFDPLAPMSGGKGTDPFAANTMWTPQQRPPRPNK